tara:strand:- start:28 stop:2649 length:2622 start_codon:yes stop_codon:yes gene_type:complete
MDPITQAFIQGAAGAAGGGTYVDDVFSNWAYKGDGSARNEPNGIDLAGEGGLVWIKDRDQANNHSLFDTERGTTKMLRLGNTTAGDETVGNPEVFSSFDSNGFTHGYWSGTGGNGIKYGSWTFRNQPGFFKVVKWTGNGVSGRQIEHGLGSVPGFVMTKALDNSDGWRTLHSYDFSKVLYISGNNGEGSSAQSFTGSVCDATHLTVTADGSINASGQEYIAYVFAGGPSSAATARSVYFDGSGDWLSTGSSSDFTMGTGDFTIECWARFDDHSNRGVFQISDSSNGLSSAGGGGAGGTIAFAHNGSSWHVYGAGSAYNTGFARTKGQWYHIAYCRSNGVSRCFVNGMQTHKFADTYNYNGTYVAIGGYYSTTYLMKGEISNFRIIKGTALYTSGFKPSTAPLTNITNTKLLCCNNSSVTGSTISPAAITSHGGTTASTASPFFDPESFIFGDDEDQNLIQSGKYIGNSSNSPEIDLGWEPQFLLIKCVSSAFNWSMYDNILGMVDNGNEKYFYPNTTDTERSSDQLEITSRGFKLPTGAGNLTNGNNDEYVYVAIRRPDPLVSKSIKVGTDAFFMTTGTINDGVEPKFRTSDFPVDFMMMKPPDSGNSWLQGSRLAQQQMMSTDSNNSALPNSNILYNYMNGWGEYISNDLRTWNGWGFRRHAGMDVVCYKGDGWSYREIPHNLGQPPEMIWIKNRDHTNTVWVAGHKGLNGGTNPWDYWIRISGGTQAESLDGGTAWGGSAPTSTHFSVGSWTEVNGGAWDYWAFLFASVSGVSKLGYYTGDNTSNGSKVITTGFQPRFIMVKCVSNAGQNWNIVDSHRGLGTGNDKTLKLNSIDAQTTGDVVDVSSSGFSLRDATDDWNANNQRYIYYAHA